MTIRPIIMFPETWLEKLSVDILPEEFGTPDLTLFAEDMRDTLLATNGVGMSAVQLGPLKNMIAIPEDQHPRAPIILCNPILSNRSSETIDLKEGCLSFLGVQVSRKRYKTVTIAAKLIDGTDYTKELTGIAAIIAQHECDHLIGKTLATGRGPVWAGTAKRKISKALKLMNRTTKTQEKIARMKPPAKDSDPKEYAFPVKPPEAVVEVPPVGATP